jgi:AcrR family transcriptional regulator
MPRGKGHDRIPEILGAALIEFERHGFAGARLDDIANRVGVTKPIIYRHFKNKEALFKALLEGSLNPDYTATIDMVRTYNGPLKPLLLGVVMRANEVNQPTSERSISLFRLIISDGYRMPVYAQKFFHQSLRPVTDALVPVFNRAMDEGRMRRADPQFAARELTAPFFQSAVVLLLLGRDQHNLWRAPEYMQAALESFCRSYDITE